MRNFVTVIARGPQRLNMLVQEAEGLLEVNHPVDVEGLSEKIGEAIQRFDPVSLAVIWIY